MKSLAIAALCALVSIGLGALAGVDLPRVAGVPVPALVAMLALGLQWLAFVPAWILRSERFYDATGSLTYLAAVALPWGLGIASGARAGLITAMVCVWALRLGGFLAWRIHRTGGDGRFDEIKRSPGRFFVTWSLQGLWVSLTLLAATLAIASPVRPLGWTEAMGAILWLLGFSVEAIADAQKWAWKQDERHRGRWCEAGLWRWSRHPNYFGEILLWAGVALSAAPSFAGWSWLGLLSPIFVYGLLRFGSGAPIAEARAEEKHGADPAFQAYRARTPLLFPRPPKA